MGAPPGLPDRAAAGIAQPDPRRNVEKAADQMNTRLSSRLGALFLAAATLLSAAAAHAQGLISEVKGGVLWHDVPNLWSGFRDEKSSADVNLEVIFSPRLPFLFGVISPALGASISTAGATSHAYLDARWHIDLGRSGLFIGLGLGAAIHDGELEPVATDRKALGSRVLFHIPAEIGWRFDAHNSVSVYFEHTSNANLADHNEGLDRLGIRYGYKF